MVIDDAHVYRIKFRVKNLILMDYIVYLGLAWIVIVLDDAVL